MAAQQELRTWSDLAPEGRQERGGQDLQTVADVRRGCFMYFYELIID